MRFEGKVAVVTGGGDGLGLIVTRGLFEEGAKVAIIDKNGDAAQKIADEINRKGGQALAVTANVGHYEEVTGGFQKIYEKFGKIDILINNAGWNYTAALRKLGVEMIDQLIAENLKGTIFCTKMVVESMREQKYGRIINIASEAAKGQAGESVYTATKGGIISFTYSMCLELAPYKITVNSVSPSVMDTPLLARGIQRGKITKEEFAHLGPMGIIPPPEKVATAVLFLASDDAEYITGHNLSVSAGMGVGMI